MCQEDVSTFLEEQQEINSNKWFTITQVQKGLKEKGFSNGVILGVRDDLYKLAAFNLIRFKGVGIWKHHKEFKAND